MVNEVEPDVARSASEARRAISPSVSPSTVTPTPTSDLTANWKTYTNTEYGYSIKYPPNWIYEEETREGSLGLGFEIHLKPVLKPDLPKPINYVPAVTLSIHENNKTLEDIMKKGNCNTPDNCIPYEETIDLLVGGYPAKMVSPPDILPTDRVFLKKDNFLFSFLVLLDKSYEDNYGLTVEKKREIFNQILSTFKFTQ